jgi:predicted O-methyltransferase YrrM
VDENDEDEDADFFAIDIDKNYKQQGRYQALNSLRQNTLETMHNVLSSSVEAEQMMRSIISSATNKQQHNHSRLNDE